MVRDGDAGEIRRLMSRQPSLAVPALVAVLLLLATATVAAATSTEVPLCNGVKLRTGPSTANTVRLVIDKTTTVTVDTQVAGSAWQSLCAGQLLSGSKWARITAVDGKSVQSRFGVPYLYAAAGLLRVVASASAPPSTRPPSHSPTGPPASQAPPPTLAPTPAATTSAPSPSPMASAVATASPAASLAPSAGAAGPITNQTGGSSDLFNGSVATVVLLLAVLSTALSWFAVADRRRRHSRRLAVPDSLPASRLEDVLD